MPGEPLDPHACHTLYAIPPSLYAGKARSYLIKNRIAYEEVAPMTSHFFEEVVPRAGGRNSMPTLETPEGEVVRDGAMILEHFEAKNGRRSTPTGPRQRILNALLDVIGMEGLMRPAMHYRWNFPEANHDLLAFHFQTMAPPGVDRSAQAERLMNAMRQATVAFGVTPATAPGIERRYTALLPLLSDHFERHPYLFGGRPSLADHSLLAPFFGHLGRDPAALPLVQSTAIHLFRWIERMNRPGLAHVDYMDPNGEPLFGDAFLEDDAIPETLVAVLRHLAIDFVPETLAAAATIEEWLAAHPDLEDGTPAERSVGMTTFEAEGDAITAMAQPYRFFLLARAQSDYDGLVGAERTAVDAVLEATGLAPVMDARLRRPLGRADNREVWQSA